MPGNERWRDDALCRQSGNHDWFFADETGENFTHCGDVQSSLRDRIIAAIARADQDWCSDDPLYEDMADAVIAELDATHRWVTEWRHYER